MPPSFGMPTLIELHNVDSNARLCIENSGDWTVWHLAEAVKMLLREFPELRLCYAVGHDESAGCVNRPFFEAHRNRIGHMHLHDARGRSNHQPLFTGEADLARYLTLSEELNLTTVIDVKTAKALRESVGALRVRASDSPMNHE